MKSNLKNIQEAHLKIKSLYMASSRLTKTVEYRKWLEKQSNKRMSMQLDLQDQAGLELYQPAAEISETKTQLNALRELVPVNKPKANEDALFERVLEKETGILKLYSDFLDRPVEDQELVSMLEKHQKAIEDNVEHLKQIIAA